MSRHRRGFTLVEVLVALVVTSTVLLVAYATLTASADARDRIASVSAGGARTAEAAGLLRDALRHVAAPDLVEEPALRIVPGPAGAAASDSLVLVTRGLAETPGTGRLWRIVLAADEIGVVLRARPLLGIDEPPTTLPPALESRLPARAVRVRVLAAAGSADWRDRWAEPVVRPAAVDIRLTDGNGRPLAPLLVRLGAPGAA